MKDKLLVELIIVLILVGFGLWYLYKDKNAVSVTTDSTIETQGVAPEGE